ncbi:MAG: hypothetical protein LBP73_03905 [Clostridiales Family XIII bacterium]|nr:hypothetical protein [Clostridiales Family XIII bacterium]
MEHGRAYRRLIDQISAAGTKEAGSYPLCTIDEIYDWERDEIEGLILNTFHKTDDLSLAEILPKLKKYDGIDALRKTLPECNIPSEHSLTIAVILYECTSDKKYLDIVKANTEKAKDNLICVGILSDRKPNEEFYRILTDIYASSDNVTIRSTAITGILYNKGFISDPLNSQEKMRIIEFSRMFMKDSKEERRDMINRLEAGEFEKFK